MWTLLIAAAVIVATYTAIIQPLYLDPLSRIPGPKLYALTKWRLAFEDWKGQRTRTIHRLHQEYGAVVRIGPNEVHFNSLSAQKTIYGPGSGFGRTAFYRMFDVYGEQNLFTFHSSREHGERKKLLASAYSKSKISRGPVAEMVARKIRDYLRLIEERRGEADEVFTSLHSYSLDSITDFLYGSWGATQAMKGNEKHRALLDDILDPARRRLSWFAVHFSNYTKWLYSRDGFLGRLVEPLLPMKKPSTYTGIRAHALEASQRFQEATQTVKTDPAASSTIIGRLHDHVSKGTARLSDLEIASECADHFPAGIDTTSDTLTFLIWSLSLPRNSHIQQKLIEEVNAIPATDLDAYGSPTVEAADRLPYFGAVIKETLRLYAPLPASEPRSSDLDSVIDGHEIPAGTVVCMSPYSLHRNSEVFPEPSKWDPERWLLGDESEILARMQKSWYWPFSSGARMCIGMQ
ncbi:P450 monooxygenase [Lecanosticta acicola]|uniref:P450 monooxygenase n=1 Tax=Lecanosticta acicola TaxID=111012 RepID=A0AAI8Z3J2_9PEZI|nr:P450 monooxygenase [Lecanosticta acicola]